MNFDGIERRTDSRTQAFVPITMCCEGTNDDMPAHLLDLSSSGAAVLTTAYDAPEIGQYLDLHFKLRRNDEDGEDPEDHRETGLVVNTRNPERGMTRLGIRFVRHRAVGADLFDPHQMLSDHRKFLPTDGVNDRWHTARNFDRLAPNELVAN